MLILVRSIFYQVSPIESFYKVIGPTDLNFHPTQYIIDIRLMTNGVKTLFIKTTNFCIEISVFKLR